MSIFEGVSRPIRAAGLGLLVVAVAAAALGGVSLVSGDETTNTASTETAEPAPGKGDDTPPESSGDGQENADRGKGEDTGDNGRGGDGDDGDGSGDSGTDGDGTNGTHTTGTGTAPDGGSGGDHGDSENQRVSVEDAPVRVYNNSKISGLATDASEDLRERGWNVVEIANYEGRIPASTVYFRPGTEEEPLARALARDFGMRVQPRFDGIDDASPGVVVIVTKDYSGPVSPK